VTSVPLLISEQNMLLLKPIYIRFLIFLSVLFLCIYPTKIHPQQTLNSLLVSDQSESEVNELKIDSIISLLSIEEKVSMCHAQSKFSSPGVPRLGIPELWMTDGPHGIRAEINWSDWGYSGWTNDYITGFPALTCLAATFNPSLSKQYGFSIGEEARYRKKDILLGPGVNIYRTPLNGRNFEYMGEDPFLASKMVVPYIKGVQMNGVAACVKHFALNNQELWRDHINVEVSDRALHEIYLPAFKAAVKQGKIWAIMGAYNKFRGQYCSHNAHLLNNILKKDWNFDGVVISDWGGTHSTKEAALNGLDIEMGSPIDNKASKRYAYDNNFLGTAFLELVKSGVIDERILNDKVRRIIRLIMRTTLNSNRPLGKINNLEHKQVAFQVATEGIVLLKNKDDFFPINSLSKLKIAVIGENAIKSMTIGGGSSELKVNYEISPLEGIKRRFKNSSVVFSLGYSSEHIDKGYDLLIRNAIETASKADVVIFIGGLNKNRGQDCESTDREELKLPYNQDYLINELQKVNPNIGVILVSGNAVSMPWISDVKSVLQSWYLGSESGNAIAGIISGDFNPSGKLPFSFPFKLTDNSAHFFGELSYPGDGENQHYLDDILVGYRWHETKNIKPLFSFGHGLSYTSFVIKDIKADKKIYTQRDNIKLSYNLKNIGTRGGAEVVQVYVGKTNSKVVRAVKELKGFKKTYLDAGNQKTETITLNVAELNFYDESISDWNLENGDYTIYVGTASDNILKRINIKIN
jgi:beta-glucosidase